MLMALACMFGFVEWYNFDTLNYRHSATMYIPLPGILLEICWNNYTALDESLPFPILWQIGISQLEVISTLVDVKSRQ